ncbi:HEPN domain-containing protein [Micromonospora echinofusca]|uniref:HEPN domain-containing protein n=1 Tax=Micromonospora echinofusca TaxID=47858 RepID=UPI001AD61CCD|nr:HEPN domain-containing protein [Micromonospora echinofusca]
MTDSSTELALMPAIAAFLERAGKVRDQLAATGDAELAKLVLAWPETRAVNTAAGAAARVHRYLYYGDGGEDHWGRRLTRNNLRALGVLEVLRRPGIPDQFPADLAAYLAGPPMPSERLVVIDAGLPVRGSHGICGWQLTQPTAADLDEVTPLPSSSQFAADPWDPALRLGGCCVLRRASDDLEARNPSVWGTAILRSLFEPELVIPAWEPLLLLNLAQTERVIVAAEYEIEPGRMVERVRGTGLDLVPAASDGIDDREEPGWGPCRLDEQELADVLMFTDIMSPLLLQWQTWDDVANSSQRKATKRASERLQRSAHRFLALGPRLGGDGGVLYERDRAEIIFWYTSALENLVITESSDGELSRKVSQRTAVLVGTDDDERLEIRRAITHAYHIRSKVAHGDVPPDTHLKTLPEQLYDYLRRAFRNLIILGPRFDVAKVCDDALMSAAVREQSIAGPVRQIVDRLPAAPGMRTRRTRYARPRRKSA